MYIYTFVVSKTPGILQFEPKVYPVDMQNLLDGNEVLSFGLDDFEELESKFHQICVQAKDLYVYKIDFTSSELLGKIETYHQINRSSIFFD